MSMCDRPKHLDDNPKSVAPVNARSACDLPPPGTTAAQHQSHSTSTGGLPITPTASTRASSTTTAANSPHASAVVMKTVGFSEQTEPNGISHGPASPRAPPNTRKTSLIESAYSKLKERRLSQSSTASTASATSTSLAKRKRVAIKFRTMIVGLIVALASLVAPLSWHFTSREAVSTSYAFGLEFQSALIEDAIESISVHLQAATGLSTLQKLHWQRGIFNFGNKQQAMQSMFLYFKEHADLLSSMIFTTASRGELWGYFTTTNKTNPSERLFFRWETQPDGTFTEYAIDSNDQVTRVVSSEPGFDVSRLVWGEYTSASASTLWSPAYVWRQSAWISIFYPFFDSSRRFLGVTSSGFDAPKINDILVSIAAKSRRPVSIYAFDARSGSILGSSSASIDLYLRDDTPSKSIIRPQTFSELAASDKDPFLSSTFRHLQSDGHVDLTRISGRSTMVIPSVVGSPTTWLVGVKPLIWGADKSLHWILFVAMNEDEVMLPNRQSTRQLLLTVLGITAAGCLVALAISRSFVGTLTDITNKLHHASKKSLATVNLATDGTPAPGSSASASSRFRIQITESIHISQAFTTMMNAFATAAADSAALVRKSSVLGRSPGGSTMGRQGSQASRAASEQAVNVNGGGDLARGAGTLPRSPSFLAPLRGEAAPRHGSMPRPTTTRSPERLGGDNGER